MSRRASCALLAAAALALGACRAVPPVVEIPAPDPNVAPRVGDATPVPVQQSAKTTLLEDNERLRALLTRALAEKRELERELDAARERAVDLDARATAQESAIASLSEQLEQERRTVLDLRARVETLEKERRALADLYALEKQQRLAFEKELLEREIAERTLGRKGP